MGVFVDADVGLRCRPALELRRQQRLDFLGIEIAHHCDLARLIAQKIGVQRTNLIDLHRLVHLDLFLDRPYVTDVIGRLRRERPIDMPNCQGLRFGQPLLQLGDHLPPQDLQFARLQSGPAKQIPQQRDDFGKKFSFGLDASSAAVPPSNSLTTRFASESVRLAVVGNPVSRCRETSPFPTAQPPRPCPAMSRRYRNGSSASTKPCRRESSWAAARIRCHRPVRRARFVVRSLSGDGSNCSPAATASRPL